MVPFEVDGHAVASLGGAFSVIEAGALFAQDVDGLVDFQLMVTSRRWPLADFWAGQITHGDFRVD